MPVLIILVSYIAVTLSRRSTAGSPAKSNYYIPPSRFSKVFWDVVGLISLALFVWFAVVVIEIIVQ